jgi:hypothetical protein
MMAAMTVLQLVACWDSWREDRLVAKWDALMDTAWDAMTAEMMVE